MKKYLLISILSVLPFTQAFAGEKDATIKAEFKGTEQTGKIIFESTADQSKKIEITPTDSPPVPLGTYNITIYNGKTDPCAALTNKELTEGKIYKAVSSADECGVKDEEVTALSR